MDQHEKVVALSHVFFKQIGIIGILIKQNHRHKVNFVSIAA